MVLVEKKYSKKTLYKIHKRLGLTLGFVLFMMAISGLTLVYRDELLPKVYSSLRVNPVGPRAAVSAQIEIAKHYLKDRPFTHLYTAERDDTATMVFFKPEGAFLPHLLAINPYTGMVQGEMPLIQNIFGVMLYLHANLFMGKVGGWIVGLMGLLLNFFFLSGIILWWPRKDFVQKIKNLKKSGLRGIHRGTGIFIGLPLVFSALTGFILAFDLTQPMGRIFGEAKKPEEIVQILPCSYEQQLNSLMLLTEEQQENIVSVHFCTAKNGVMKFTYGHDERSGHDGYVRIVVDPRSQQIIQKFDTKSDPAGWSSNALLIYPMHTGAYFGGLGRILNIICGLALGTLYITGLLAALKRKPLPQS